MLPVRLLQSRPKARVTSSRVRWALRVFSQQLEGITVAVEFYLRYIFFVSCRLFRSTRPSLAGLSHFSHRMLLHPHLRQCHLLLQVRSSPYWSRKKQKLFRVMTVFPNRWTVTVPLLFLNSTFENACQPHRVLLLSKEKHFCHCC